MNSREIDRLVAEKVMGWKIYTDSAGYKFWSINEDERSKIICSVTSFEPTKDIADAWKVVEKIIEQFGSYSLTKIKDGGHYCEVLYWNNGAFDVIAEVEAETAPLAICLAVLKAVGVEVEGENDR